VLLEISPEALEFLFSLCGSVYDLGLQLKDRATFLFNEHAEQVSHSPPRQAEQTQTLGRDHQQRSAVPARYDYALWVPVVG
jgi:hypothetical protein